MIPVASDTTCIFPACVSSAVIVRLARRGAGAGQGH